MIDAQIDALERQIAEYDRQIDEIEDQIEAVDALIALEQLDQLDPTNPEHQRLLRAAGYNDPDAWGTLTLADFERRRRELSEDKDELERRKDEARDRQDDLRNQRAELSALGQQAERSDGRVDVRSLVSESAISRLSEQDENFRPDSATGQEVFELVVLDREDRMLARRDTMSSEQEWFEESVRDIEYLRGTPEYTRMVDRMIGELTEDTKVSLLAQNDLDPAARERLVMDRFREKYEDLAGSRTDPAYSEFLSMELEAFDESERAILLRQSDLPEDVRSALVAMNPSAYNSGAVVAAPA